MAWRLIGLGLLFCWALASAAWAEPWSRTRIARLPDEAFAVVEVGADGRRLRHLPHHDETGAVDRAHLRAAGARLGQVKWLDPAHAEPARQHLEAHWQALGRSPTHARRAGRPAAPPAAPSSAAPSAPPPR